jgi:hypothetical protein
MVSGPPLHLKCMVALLLIIPLTAASAAQDESYPSTLAVKVEYGLQQGPESFREEFARRLIHAIQGDGCIRKTLPACSETESEAGLLLIAMIEEMEQRTDHDLSISERNSPHATAAESRRLTARMEAAIELRLLLLPGRELVRERKFRAAESYRPRMNEDAAYEVQLQLLENLTVSGRRFICKGGGKKLRKDIEKSGAIKQ